MAELDRQRILNLLNRILEAELAGVVWYTHYSFLVFGHNRIPIVSMRKQAAESLRPSGCTSAIVSSAETSNMRRLGGTGPCRASAE
jgi:bacterioferritin (cytochrome b1)